MSGHVRATDDAGPGAWPRDASLFLVSTLFAAFVLLVIRTAWLSDDAFITLRTVDNLVHGYGPRWNTLDRVQAFTHPLWMMALAVPYAVTREPYFTTLLLSMACAFAAVWMLAFRLSAAVTATALALVVLMFSKAFVEYSTSGLENPLTFLLLAAFLSRYWRPGVSGSDPALWALAGLILLNRLDAGLLILPAVLSRAAAARWRPVLRGAALGLLPVAAWHLFSVVYYGTALPNTAYAKLQTGITSSELMAQGMLYLLDSLAHDPVTLLGMSVMVALSLWIHPRASWPLAIGILLYLAYVVRIGGDFMSGRFLAAPLFCAVAMFAHHRWNGLARTAPIVAAVVVLLGWQATTRPPITSGPETFILAAADGMGGSGIADERAFYYRYTGLLRWSRDLPLPHSQEVIEGRAARDAGGVVVRSSVGLFGFYAGPSVHVVDTMGLGDPFLARLPIAGPWRIGHFSRTLPEGYIETLESGHTRIADPALAMRYERLALVTRDPLWSARRWREIGRVHGLW